jgi:hypothetical protein
VLEIERRLQTVIAAYKEVCEDMQNEAKQLKITSFFIKVSVSPFGMQSALFDHHDNLQPGVPMSFQ